MLERYHLDFKRAGAALDPPAKARLAAINERLASLGTTFSQNVLADEQAYTLVLEGEADLAGLPDYVRDAARAAAQERGLAQGHVITLSRSSVEPFLQFSARRDLREKAFRAWIARGEGGGKTDNKAVIAEMVALRAERAGLLGYQTFAHYRLDDAMAKTPAAVRGLLERVWAPARARALARARCARQELAQSQGGNFELAAWDWRYYAEKQRMLECDVDEASIKPYLQLDRMIEAAFYTAGKLFGLSFERRTDVPVWHPDVQVWEVRGADGSHRGVFFGDYFARSSKRSGAWMTTLRDQEKLAGDIRPLVVNVMNFSKGGDGEPTLLSFDDARTLFHELGHGLHALLSNVTYPSISGTSVQTDFVELPSQLYEHWLEQPEILRKFALHYRTGAAMPDDLLAAAARRPHLQPGLCHGRICRLRAGRSRAALVGRPARLRRHRVRASRACAHRHAGRDGDAPPPDPFHPCVRRRRLCVGLLQLHVVGGARRRRVRGVRGGARYFRSRHRRAAARARLCGRRLARACRALRELPRPAADPGCPVAPARTGRGDGRADVMFVCWMGVRRETGKE